MKQTNIQKFLIEHGIEQGIQLLQQDPYNLKISEQDNRILFRYDMINSSLSLPIVQEARGIILDRNSLQIYCRPFNKFFNLNESKAYEFDYSKEFLIQEKLDGSLIKLYYYLPENRWVFATNGTIEFNEQQEVLLPDYSKDLVTFDNLLNDTVDLDQYFFEHLHSHNTYLFELIHPNNPIVVNTGDKSLTLIGIRNNITGQEEQITTDNAHVTDILDASHGQLSIPDVYSIPDLSSVSEPCEFLTSHANSLSKDRKKPCQFEGLIVSELNSDGTIAGRVKVKTLKYLLFHRISQPKEAINIFLKGFQEGEEDEFGAYIDNAPEHIKSIYKSYRSAFEKIIQDLNATVEDDRAWFHKLQKTDPENARKRVALHLKDQPNGKMKMSIIFNQLSAREYLKQKSFRSFKKMMKSKIKE